MDAPNRSVPKWSKADFKTLLGLPCSPAVPGVFRITDVCELKAGLSFDDMLLLAA